MINPLHIAIVDDHRLVRDGMKSVIERSPEFKVVLEAENGKQFIEKLKQKEAIIDVVLLDITMPVLSGIETIPEVRDFDKEIGIIMLSMHEEPEFVIKSIESGAHSYLLKNVEPEELYKAIKKVAQGEKYFNADTSLLLAEGLSIKRKAEKNKIELTDREIEVLQAVAEGLSTKQISDKLFIGVRTVETHRLNLLKKFGAQNAAELIRMALERKIIQVGR